MPTNDQNTPLLPAPEQPRLLTGPPPPSPPSPTPPSPPSQPSQPSQWQRRAKPLTAIALAAFVLLAFAIGWFLHHRNAAKAEDANEAERRAMPIVTVVAAKHSPALSDLLLPGNLAPITEASLYARASGYVLHRYVDLGDTVTKGQVLAEIDSPELDANVAQGLANVAQAKQQLNQQRAAVGDARAKLDLARVTWQRYETLLQQDAASRQDADQRRQEYDSAQAMLVSAQANVGAAAEAVRAAEANQRRLAALQQYERLRAPFDGIITARNVDEGALISSAGASLSSSGGMGTSSGSGGSPGSGGGSSGSGAGGSGGDSGSSASGGAGGSGAELFRIAQIQRLRVYVSVPQESAGAVQVGAPAAVLLQEFGAPFGGRVTRTSGAIDPTSRTLLAEVQIDNAAHTLMPGMFAQVRFSSSRSNPPLLVPGEALVARADGTRVAVLQPLTDEQRGNVQQPADRRCARVVQLRPVTVGRDYGTQVEVTRGLRDGDFLLLSPGDGTPDGGLVLPQLQPADGEGTAGAGAGGQAGKGGGGGASAGGGAGGAGGASGSGGGKNASKDKKDGGKDGGKDGKGHAHEQQQRRAQVQQTCIEDQAHAAAANTPQTPPAPAGQASNAAMGGASASAGPGGPSDRMPSGIQSPSIAAPTQGQRKPGGAGAKP